MVDNRTEQALIGSTASNGTTFMVENLLSQQNYVFTIVAVNQYNLSSPEDLNMIHITTLLPALPSAVEILSVSNITGGSAELAFTPATSTGGFARASIKYRAMFSSLLPCLSTASTCSSCTHYYDDEKLNYQPLYGSCELMPCGAGDECCLYGDYDCGVPTETIYNCTNATSPCEVSGLQASSLYVVSMVAKNILGFSGLSNSVVVRTRYAMS